MNKLILLASAAILSVGTTSELRASTDCPWGQTCIKCGDDCWAYLTGSGNNKTLNIIGTGEMYDTDVSEGYTTGKYYYKDNQGNKYETHFKSDSSNITALNIGKGITSLGSRAFYRLPNITDVSIPEGVSSMGSCVFDASGVVNITLPKSLISIPDRAFQDAKKLENIAFSDNLSEIGYYVFWGTQHLETLYIPDKTIVMPEALKNTQLKEIICLGNMETCKTNFKLGLPCIEFNDKNQCIAHDYSKLVPANENNCTGSHYWNGESCKSKVDGINCISGYKQNENFCNRVRYTPAEAAAVAKDDNTNVVTITFKK